MGQFIIGQLLAIINGIFLLKSMRVTSKNKFLVFNTLANLFGCLSMITLGAYAASIGPIVLTIQSLVTHRYEKKGKKQPKGILALYLILNLLGGMLTVNSVLSILPVLSSSLACIMIMSKDMKTSRKINLVSSILALPYLVINKAYVSALIFGSSFINTIDAIYKLDYKGQNEEIELEKEDIVTEDFEEKQIQTLEEEKNIVETLECYMEPVALEEEKILDKPFGLKRTKKKRK